MAQTFAIAIVLLSFRQQPEPCLFIECPRTGKHVAIKHISDNTSFVHCHVRFKGLAGKQAFARVRCFASTAPGKGVTHLDHKEIEIEGAEEDWYFFLKTYRFPPPIQATYQLEVGEIDPSEVDEYRVRTSFPWRFKDGKMVTGTPQSPLTISLRSRAVIVENGMFRIRSQYQMQQVTTELRYGIVDTLDIPSDASKTAGKD